MKIRKTISPRIIKRWTTMCGLAAIVLGLSFFGNHAVSDVLSFDMDNFED